MLSLHNKCTGKHLPAQSNAVTSTDCHQCAESRTEAAPEKTTCVGDGGEGN